MSAPYRLLATEDRVRWWSGLAQRGVPALVTLLLIAAMTVPVFAAWPVLPHLGLLGVFVWASFQPGLMPPWCAFVLGCVADLLFGLPLGINAVLLPMVALAVRLVDAKLGQHRYSVDWQLATAMIIVFELAQWGLLAFAGMRGPFLPLVVQAATTIVAYPAIVSLCARIQRRMQPE